MSFQVMTLYGAKMLAPPGPPVIAAWICEAPISTTSGWLCAGAVSMELISYADPPSGLSSLM